MIRIIGKHLVGSKFFFFSVLVAAISYYLRMHFIPEYRPVLWGLHTEKEGDQFFYLSLPFVFEFSFLVTTLIAIAFQKCVTSVDVDHKHQTLCSKILCYAPLVAGCYSLMELPSSPWTLPVYIMLGCVLLQILWQKFSSARLYWWTVGLCEFIAAVFVVYMAVKSLVLTGTKDNHHWAFYLGPLYQTLEGAKLLWDSPSQYGFLNILWMHTIVRIFDLDPVAVVMIQASALHLAGTFLLGYLLFTRAGTSPLVTALSVVAISLMFPGDMTLGFGPLTCPSHGGIRFCPALISLLLAAAAITRRSRGLFLVASIALVISALWSAESFSYSVPPLIGFLVVHIVLNPHHPGLSGRVLKLLALSLLLGVLFLFAYRYYLTPSLDLTGFYEYVSLYAHGRNSIIVIHDAWLIFFVFFLAMTYFFARVGLQTDHRRGPLVVIFFSYSYLVWTYYVSRGNFNHILCILPWALIGTLLACSHFPHILLKKLFVNLILAICFLSINYAANIFSRLPPSRVIDMLSDRRPWVGPHLDSWPSQLITSLQQNFHAEELTVLTRMNVLRPPIDAPSTGFYLHVVPMDEFLLLPEERRREYLKRMGARKPRSFVSGEEDMIKKLTVDSEGIFSWKQVPSELGWPLYELTSK